MGDLVLHPHQVGWFNYLCTYYGELYFDILSKNSFWTKLDFLDSVGLPKSFLFVYYMKYLWDFGIDFW